METIWIYANIRYVDWFFLTLSLQKVLTRHVELHLSGILSVDVADDDLVFAFIVGLYFPHAEGDEACIAIRDVFEAATLDDLGDSLVEFECWWRVTLHLYCEVASLVYRNKKKCYVDDLLTNSISKTKIRVTLVSEKRFKLSTV